jgi:hypothetical protein
MMNSIFLSKKGATKLVSCLLVSSISLVPLKIFSQYILDVTADVPSQPNTFQIYGFKEPGFISVIDIYLSI